MRKKQKTKLNSIAVIIFLGFIWITFNQTGLIKLLFLYEEKNNLLNEISILDILPTILDMLGKELPSNLRGKSCLISKE